MIFRNQSGSQQSITTVFAISLLLLLAACQGGETSDAAERVASAPETGPGPNYAPGPVEGGYGTLNNVIRFETDSYALTAEAQDILRQQAKWLSDYPAWALTVEGHADERGTREYNLALGERRANAAAGYLVASGVSATRLSVISYGKERPDCSPSTEECWAQNRRAVTVVNTPQ